MRSQLHVHYPSTDDTETNILFSMDGASLIAWQWDLVVAAEGEGSKPKWLLASVVRNNNNNILCYYYSLRVFFSSGKGACTGCFAGRVHFSFASCSRFRDGVRIAPKTFALSNVMCNYCFNDDHTRFLLSRWFVLRRSLNRLRLVVKRKRVFVKVWKNCEIFATCLLNGFGLLRRQAKERNNITRCM